MSSAPRIRVAERAQAAALHADPGAHPRVRPRAGGPVLGLRLPDHHGPRPRLRLPRPAARSRAGRRGRGPDRGRDLAGAREGRHWSGRSPYPDREAGLHGLRTGKITLLVEEPAGAASSTTSTPTRPDARLARLEVDDAIQRARGRTDPSPRAPRVIQEKGSRYIDFLFPGILGLNLMGTGIWGVGFSIVNARLKKTLKLMVATPMRKSRLPARADAVAVRVPGARGRRHPRVRRLGLRRSDPRRARLPSRS